MVIFIHHQYRAMMEVPTKTRIINKVYEQKRRLQHVILKICIAFCIVWAAGRIDYFKDAIMGKVFEHITDDLQEFIGQQPIFFVATAPLDADGHVNLSPKGYNVFRILSPNRVAYLDVTGSGNETSAHLLENGRITFMFCAFVGAPKILRLYGQGQVILPNMREWDDLSPHFMLLPGTRQIIVAEIDRVQTSCGFAVPLMDYVGERDTLIKWAETKGDEALVNYRREKNQQSIDALPTPLHSLYGE